MPKASSKISGNWVGNPFLLLDDDTAYLRWRDRKLSEHPRNTGDLVVEIRDLSSLTETEHAEILRRCRQANMAVYAGPTLSEFSKEDMLALGSRFGLLRLDKNMLADDDGITPLAVSEGESGRNGVRRKYIPYTDHPISWHTDGYYNPPERTVRGLMLHCVRPAQDGGSNDLIDPEIVYIRLRDESADHIQALMRPDAMTIPANDEEGFGSRPDGSGPVFSVNAADGTLHMRYTHRVRNIRWSPAPAVTAAVAALHRVLASADPFLFQHRLAPGQGLICNNVLHTRTGFTDDTSRPRLLYRARYFDRVAGTENWRIHER
ncbi:MAG: TauD/TfdA family dioxygenase [Alphaproteobacteria bacterium]